MNILKLAFIASILPALTLPIFPAHTMLLDPEPESLKLSGGARSCSAWATDSCLWTTCRGDGTCDLPEGATDPLADLECSMDEIPLYTTCEIDGPKELVPLSLGIIVPDVRPVPQFTGCFDTDSDQVDIYCNAVVMCNTKCEPVLGVLECTTGSLCNSETNLRTHTSVYAINCGNDGDCVLQFTKVESERDVMFARIESPFHE